MKTKLGAKLSIYFEYQKEWQQITNILKVLKNKLQVNNEILKGYSVCKAREAE